ncbi:selenium metabolism protein YedF [Dethiosulfatibacter aminovorans DSM 17477]|uniref:Selenium metabolism protein YedF n=1 Tax=Dethiosulfatibacter aminovorans DSM 17477 TaxID=1121476 RepID=A0A1M6AJM3_9FIRM|nr:sulfurtransferase-like selenium metabolism protein YedF [Dethiosulfatibacter aminovorans]SHI36714.1 selenium metabolism protein YedF [Dethiosulfatibacter aminovorans DSM 17477]
MKEIDARGLACPQPVILTKKALEESKNVMTIVDNETAKTNLLKLAKKMNCEVAVKDESDGIKISMYRDNIENAKPEEGNLNAEVTTSSGGMVYVFGKDTLGEGSDELGKLLMKGFIYTLTEMDVPPAKIAFLNGGVNLTCEGSESIEDLKTLESKGTEIVSCGTCLNYFEISDKLLIGEVSNMYDIVEVIASGGNTVMI